jgi:hypothetical protein
VTIGESDSSHKQDLSGMLPHSFVGEWALQRELFQGHAQFSNLCQEVAREVVDPQNSLNLNSKAHENQLVESPAEEVPGLMTEGGEEGGEGEGSVSVKVPQTIVVDPQYGAGPALRRAADQTKRRIRDKLRGVEGDYSETQFTTKLTDNVNIAGGKSGNSKAESSLNLISK